MLLLSLCLARDAFAWVQEPSPLGEGHLAIIHPDDFVDGAGKPIAPARTAGALFNEAITVATPVQATTRVKAAGEYSLWLRVAEGKPQKPLTVELLQDGNVLFKQVVNDGPGGAGKGGAEGYRLFRDEALTRNAEGTKDPGDNLLTGGEGIGDILNEMRLENNPGMRWVNSSRIEDLRAGRFFWWKAGTATLKPGVYTLRLGGGPAVFNAAFLTTTNLTYPFGGDIDIPPASYIRFRVDSLPKGGLNLTAMMRIHANPYFQTSTGYFSDIAMTDNPTDRAAQRITKTGYTAWYRLQDLEHAPGFGGGKAHLVIATPPGARGATQFAVFPHGDEAVREIDWSEPEGTTITLVTDFKTHLHQLRTFLDHAREHYDYALSATGERLFPLIRSGRYFGSNVRGDGDSGDYALKTMRLIGANLTSGGPDAVANRDRYGWHSEIGGGWQGAGIPFDEEKTRAAYAKVFGSAGKSFTGDDVNRIVTWYLADEPGEAATTEMTAPFWKFYGPDKNGPRWVDFAGGSDLNFKRTDLSNYVVEGKIVKMGGNIGFSVGFSDPTNPNDGYGWWLGSVSQNRLDNFAFGKRDDPRSRRAYQKPEARLNDNTPTPFKIVYEGTAAALYLNGKLVHLATDLPPRGGIGFTGGAKAITALEIRPVRGKDRGAAAPKMADPGMTADIPELEMDDDGPLPNWAKPKPLEQLIKEDWVESGGIPEARVGFRKWAAAQGVKPELFGKKAWNEVNLLTIKELAETDADRRLYYWSRRYAGYLTPLMFSMAAEAIRDAAPNKDIKAIVALSGHSLYFPSAMPLDMFALASYGGPLAPGISDFMSTGLRWDSQQAIAFSVAPYHSGARVYPGAAPAGWPTDKMGPRPRSTIMMHCGWSAPTFNAYTQLANGVEIISYYHFGPEYLATEWYWSENPGAYQGPHKLGNRAAQVDDVLAKARMRPSRVAMLYARSTEYWNAQASFTDKRASFLGLSHEYFQPELVTEEQVAAGALDYYDAVYVVEPWVSDATQARIKAFVEKGGLLWTSADALRWNEYGDNADFLKNTFGLARTYTEATRDTTMKPVAGEAGIVQQATPKTSVDKVTWDGAKVRAQFGDGRPAWLEKSVGKGRVVYLAFRAGTSYTNQAVRIGGEEVVWGDSGRAPLTLPLHEAKVARELILSQPSIMAQPLTSDSGTIVVLYNMQGDTARNVTVRLKAAQAPRSVQTFDDMTLINLPFTFRDGWVEMTLPTLVREQLIAVRDTPAPADDRLEKMQAKTRAMLASTDWEDLTAGAWFAGFYPSWKMADALLPLLAHENGMVRRAGAEALGRLKYAPAAAALATRVPQEKHPHAVAEMLMALAELNDDRFPALARAAMERPQAYIQMQTLKAASGYLQRKRAAGGISPDLRAFAQSLYDGATANPDQRVYLQAIPLLAAFDPQRCLELLGDREKHARFRNALIAAVASDDALFTAWLATKPDNDTLLAIASRRTDERLPGVLLTRLDALVAQAPGPLYAAAERQGNPQLTRALFARYAELKDPLKSHMAVLLERTFNARIGNNLDTWREYLAKHK